MSPVRPFFGRWLVDALVSSLLEPDGPLVGASAEAMLSLVSSALRFPFISLAAVTVLEESLLWRDELAFALLVLLGFVLPFVVAVGRGAFVAD